MVSKIHTGTLSGIDAYPVTAEVDLASGLPGLTIVGLPDASVNEAKERVKAAIKNSGFDFPLKKVVINLAPADLRKEGAGFDLPLAVGILLAASSLSDAAFLESACFIGEVSLSGDLRRVNGALSLALMARAQGLKHVIVPEANVLEASLVDGIHVYGLAHLRELPVLFLHPQTFERPVDHSALMAEAHRSARTPSIDMADVKGQQAAKRALEVAAAGGHNMLMVGPPGSGKSMLAKAFSGILPPLTFDEMLEVSRIYSVAGLLTSDYTADSPSEASSGKRPQQGLMFSRPFRSPHHSASMAGLTGGGSHPKPGEITLAHRGVLFLDECVEFPRPVLEVLRQPLEDGEVTVSRAAQSTTFPAKFILLGAMNPCPCGYLGDPGRTCTDTEFQVQRYISRLSGPLLDRIDIHLELPRISETELLGITSTVPSEASPSADSPPVETSAVIRERVIAARKRQEARYADTGIYCNAEMTPAHMRDHAQLDDAGLAMLKRAIQRLNLSARSCNRLLKLSRTLADLDASDPILPHHVGEALRFRALDRLYQKAGTITR